MNSGHMYAWGRGRLAKDYRWHVDLQGIKPIIFGLRVEGTPKLLGPLPSIVCFRFKRSLHLDAFLIFTLCYILLACYVLDIMFKFDSYPVYNAVYLHPGECLLFKHQTNQETNQLGLPKIKLLNGINQKVCLFIH